MRRCAHARSNCPPGGAWKPPPVGGLLMKNRSHQKAKERQKCPSKLPESSIARQLGLRQLPRRFTEVSGLCAACRSRFDRFSKFGAVAPKVCFACEHSPGSKEARARQARAIEELALRHISELAQTGTSPGAIAARLNKLGHCTRRIPKGSWRNTHVRNILKRRVDA